jgi:hypothetical protein
MIRYLLDPSRSALVFAGAIIFGYAVIPIWFYFQAPIIDKIYLQLAIIATLAGASILLGFHGSNTPAPRTGRFELSIETFTALVWVPFLVTATLIIATAPAIPLVTALHGGSPDLIAMQREEFLKAREGFAGIFVYLNAFFTGALIPYSIALMFINKFRWRWALTALFLVYSVSFLEKAFFFKLILPLLYLFGTGAVKSRFGTKTTIDAAAVILLTVTTLSGSGSDYLWSHTSGDFFSENYSPTSPLMHIVWRSLAVPVFTAADALRVFNTYFGGEPFYGATSSFFADILGMKRILFERIVFAIQWGQNETGTGSSNSVYVTEAFVNFSWIGVILFSLFIGRSLKWFARSRDEAFQSIWLLYVMGLYSAGLIGQLLSNGFVMLLMIGLFVHVRPYAESYSANKGEHLKWGT